MANCVHQFKEIGHEYQAIYNEDNFIYDCKLNLL